MNIQDIVQEWLSKPFLRKYKDIGEAYLQKIQRGVAR